MHIEQSHKIYLNEDEVKTFSDFIDLLAEMTNEIENGRVNGEEFNFHDIFDCIMSLYDNCDK